MPNSEEPQWPSADEDAASKAAARASEGKTTELPLPKEVSVAKPVAKAKPEPFPQITPRPLPETSQRSAGDLSDQQTSAPTPTENSGSSDASRSDASTDDVGERTIARFRLDIGEQTVRMPAVQPSAQSSDQPPAKSSSKPPTQDSPPNSTPASFPESWQWPAAWPTESPAPSVPPPAQPTSSAQPPPPSQSPPPTPPELFRAPPPIVPAAMGRRESPTRYLPHRDAVQPSEESSEDAPTVTTVPVAHHARPMRIEPTGEVHADEARTVVTEAVTPPAPVKPSDTATDSPQEESPAEKTPDEAKPEPDNAAESENTPKAEAVADADPAKSDAPPAAPPKRRKRGLLVGALVLVLVVVVGVALAIPVVSNRLALPWAPNAPKGPQPLPAAVTRVLHGPDASSPAPTESGVRNALSALAGNSALGTLAGSVIDPATGTALWDQNSDQALTPASTTKVLTTAAALLAVDHGLQLSTKVVAGAQAGTVVLVAGGDPTLSSLPKNKESVYPGAAHLDDLVAQVKAAVGGPVKNVQLDLSAFSGAKTAPGWAPEDAPSTYAAPVVPAMLDGGRTSATDPKAPRSADPAAALAQEFAKRLGATAQPATVKAKTDAPVLGEVRSAPLTELVDTLLQSSDNLLADVIARQTAIATGEEPSFAGGAKATLKVLSQNGFDMSAVKLSDGSGLSTLNKVPAKVLSGLLASAAGPDGKDAKTVKLRPLLEGLPVAGGSGTLAARYLDPSSSKGKGWVRAKTGTLSGVNTLAGVVLDTDGRILVFALMSSSTASEDEVRKALDALPAVLHTCGCR